MNDLPKYAHYKESGIEWLGEIPSHWLIKQLKFATTCNDETLNEATEPDKEILYVDISNVSLTEGIGHKERMIFENSPSRARRIVKDGDIIISTVRTYLKAITQIRNAEENLVVSTGFAVLRHKPEIVPNFLGYWVQSNGFISSIVANSVGVSYPAINATDLIRLPIIILPKEEQKAIVSFLDKKIAQIDTLISKQEMLLEKLAEQRIALISHAVTKGINPDVEMKESGVEWLGKIPSHWKFVSIKHLTQVKRGASPRPINNPEYFDDNGEYAWVRIADVTNSNKYLIETTQRLSQFGSSFSVKLQPNSIFLSIAGSVGKPIITQIKVCIHDGFVYFPDWQHSIEFLYYIFESGQPYLGLGKLGTQLNLNTDTVGNIKIGLPSLKEQKAIVSFLDKKIDKINCTELSLYECITKLKEYRSALITQAVTGKIDVRNLNQ